MNAPPDRSATNPRLSQASAAPAATAAQAPVAQPPQAEVDVAAMVRRVFAHWHVVIVTLVLGGLITSQIVKTRVPAFKSETVIFYREGIGKSVTGATDDKDAIRALGTKLKETLLAQTTLRRVIDEFHLYADTVAVAGYADAVEQMRKKTDFKSRSQDTFAISFEGTNKDEAQKVCARMAEILVNENAKRMNEDQRSTMEFLEVEHKRASEELDRMEREISEFLTAHPEFVGAKEGLGTEVGAQQKKVAAEEAKRKRATSKGGGGGGRRNAAAAGAPPGPASGPAAAAVDPVLLTARTAAMTELLAAKRDLSDKSSRYTEAHPDVRSAQARVSVAEESLKRAEDAVAAAQPKDDAPPPRKVASVEDPYGGGEDAGAPRPPSDPAAAAAAAASAEARRPIATEPRDKVVNLEMEWTRLNRTLTIVRVRASDMEQKLYRAEMVASTTESGYGTTIAVLDPAYKPSAPSNAPNRTVVMIGLAASVVVGLVLSAAWGLFLDDRVFSPLEIEGIVMVPVLGAVPRGGKPSKKKDKGDKGKGAGKPDAAAGAPAAGLLKKRWGRARG
jgi:uncharacterized protein involved in exopolysaccharide biosynthesis